MRAVIKLLLQDQRGIAASAGANADAPAARNSLWRRLSNLSLGLPPHLHHLSPPALQHLKIQDYADETGLRRFRRLFIDVDVKKLESSLLPFLVAHLAHIRSGCFHHPPVYFRSASKLAFLLCSNRAGSRVSYLSIALIQRIIGLAQCHLRCDGEDARAEVSQSEDATAEGTLNRAPEETVLCRFSDSGSGSGSSARQLRQCARRTRSSESRRESRGG
jgi:hypothetical protein